MYKGKFSQAVRPRRSICLFIGKQNAMGWVCDKTKGPSLRAANCGIEIRKPTEKQMEYQSSFLHGFLCASQFKTINSPVAQFEKTSFTPS